MTVDKNLFLYDVALVASLYNEGHYLKEWIDYHLLAGVNHFYLYNNGSTDNYDEIVKPYVEKGLVTSINYPGEALYFTRYYDAVFKYRFLCRYMAFIDGDEFIFPQNNKTIGEVVDEILTDIPEAGGLAINWQFYGSNYQDKADYTRGVLERFTRRALKNSAPIINGSPNGNAVVKNIVNPRCVKYFGCPHNISYFLGRNGVNSDGKPVYRMYNAPVLHDKIVINHYHTKSREEYFLRKSGGDSLYVVCQYDIDHFDECQRSSNEEFDDSILNYRDFRQKALVTELDEIRGGGVYDSIEKFSKLNAISYQKVFQALLNNLVPTFSKDTPKEFLNGKMETFLTCRALSAQLKTQILDEAIGNSLEEVSLNAIFKVLTVSENVSIYDILLLLSELPNILSLPYKVVGDIRSACIDIIPSVLHFYRLNRLWREAAELEYLEKMLKII